MNYSLIENGVILHNIKCFNLDLSCDCGQAFRWKHVEGEGWHGVIGARSALLRQEGSDIMIKPCSKEDIPFWRYYLDLDRDYEAIENMVASDPVLGVCMEKASGIRLFNQPPFEALISFIISANNNIKRISGIIARLCELCGEKLSDGAYAFPTPEAIADLTVEQLSAIGAGYRSPYIIDTARRIADGYDLLALKDMPLFDARKELLSFKGVGLKVADCVLLFSLGHFNAFPMDVWMNRAMDELYFGGKRPDKKQLEQAINALGEYSGIVQQYIFHYARMTKLGVAKK
ncbi:MAG: DNA-3-methyladenine glycosylase 2 family protein [Clostridia bacterium]|nr:DNA-3-methyladenine glycosylase 2 family protein [Clostridia bacterium]